MKNLFIGVLRTFLAFITAIVLASIFTAVLAVMVGIFSITTIFCVFCWCVIFFVVYTSYITWSDTAIIYKWIKEHSPEIEEINEMKSQKHITNMLQQLREDAKRPQRKTRTIFKGFGIQEDIKEGY